MNHRKHPLAVAVVLAEIVQRTETENDAAIYCENILA
jgi:hypothetical protein